jgi:hypothetical protein
MVFQKGRPRPPLRVKTCVICRKSFQPSSGAQKNCGEPECKAQAKALNLANRKASKTRLDVKEEIDRVFSLNRFTGEPLMSETSEDGMHVVTDGDGVTSHGGANGRSSAEPILELDLTPLETYVKQIVALAGATPQPAAVGEDLREMVREIVREEITARLKPLLGG